MRKLLIAAMGFSTAIALAVYLLPGRALPLFALVLVLAAVLLGQRCSGLRRLRLCLILIPAAAGLLWTWGYDQVFLRPAAQWAGETMAVTGRALEYSVQGTDSSTALLRVELPDGRCCKVQVYDSDNLLPELEPGDLVVGSLRLRDAGLRRGEETESYRSRGISMVAYPTEEVTVTGRWEHSWLYGPARLAHVIS